MDDDEKISDPNLLRAEIKDNWLASDNAYAEGDFELARHYRRLADNLREQMRIAGFSPRSPSVCGSQLRMVRN
jgi:hypothetical protein